MISRYRRIRDIVLDVADLPAAQRDRLIRSRCAGDDDLRRDVESLLAHDGPDDDFGALLPAVPTTAMTEVTGMPDRIGSPTARTRADLIGNKNTDLVVAGASGVSVIKNDSVAGSMDFNSAVNIDPQGTPQSITSVDLDGDADPDIAVIVDVGGFDRLIRVVRNDFAPGDETIQLVLTETIYADDTDPVLITSGDVDGDGLDDPVAILGAAGGSAAGGAGSGVDVFINASDSSCTGDANGNGAVDVEDLVAVILAWGTDDADADINGDGVVDVQDLVQILLNWGACP